MEVTHGRQERSSTFNLATATCQILLGPHECDHCTANQSSKASVVPATDPSRTNNVCPAHAPQPRQASPLNSSQQSYLRLVVTMNTARASRAWPSSTPARPPPPTALEQVGPAPGRVPVALPVPPPCPTPHLPLPLTPSISLLTMCRHSTACSSRKQQRTSYF